MGSTHTPSCARQQYGRPAQTLTGHTSSSPESEESSAPDGKPVPELVRVRSCAAIATWDGAGCRAAGAQDTLTAKPRPTDGLPQLPALALAVARELFCALAPGCASECAEQGSQGACVTCTKLMSSPTGNEMPMPCVCSHTCRFQVAGTCPGVGGSCNAPHALVGLVTSGVATSQASRARQFKSCFSFWREGEEDRCNCPFERWQNTHQAAMRAPHSDTHTHRAVSHMALVHRSTYVTRCVNNRESLLSSWCRAPALAGCGTRGWAPWSSCT